MKKGMSRWMAGLLAAWWAAGAVAGAVAGEPDITAVMTDAAGVAATKGLTLTVGEAPEGGVEIEPDPPVAGEAMTVKYWPEGRALEGAAAVYVHHGYNDYDWTSDEMIWSGSHWECTFGVPEEAESIAMCFHNGEDLWDNNDYEDWRYAVSAGPFGIVLDHPAHFSVEMGTEATITASAKNGTEPYTFVWTGDTPELNGSGNILFIPATLDPGYYTVEVWAVDAEGNEAMKMLSFSVIVPPAQYQILVDDGIENGSILVDRTEAEEGEIVTLTAMPDSGYRLVGILVNGEPVAGTTFTMPASDVVVSAEFAEYTGGVFVKIASVDELTASEYVITGEKAEGEEYAMKAEISGGSTKYIARREGAVTLEGDTVTDADDDIVWTLAQGTNDWWTIYNEAIGYVGYVASGNSAGAEAEPSDKSSWMIAAADNGLFRLTNVGNTNRYLGYNASSPRFACYSSVTGRTLAFYKKAGPVGANIGYSGATTVQIPNSNIELQFVLENYSGAHLWTVTSHEGGSIDANGLYVWTAEEAGVYDITVAAVAADGEEIAEAIVSVVVVEAEAEPGRHFAVCVGIDKYKTSYIDSYMWLDTCVTDANRIWTNITERGEWTAATATRLLDSAATKAAVRAAITNAAAECRSGDTFFYFQSSHADSNGGDDVYLCTHDADYQDSELAADLAKFASGVKVVVMADACNSGGLFKPEAGVAARGKKGAAGTGGFALAERVGAAIDAIRAGERTRGANGARGIRASEIGWITAADSDQFAWNGEVGGAFTDAVIEGWNTGACDEVPCGDGDGWANFYELWNYAKDIATGGADSGGDSTDPQCCNTNVLLSVIAGWAGADTRLAAPESVRAENVTAASFDAAWDAVDGASAYGLLVQEWVVSATNAAGEELLEEDFAAFTATASSDISSRLDAYTDVAGWTGYKAFCSNGCVKLGTSSAAGWIATPSLDLPAGAVVSATFAKYGSDTGGVAVAISTDGGSSWTDLCEAFLPSTNGETRVFAIAEDSAEAMIRFGGNARASRFYLDDVKVMSGSGRWKDLPGFAPKGVTGTSAAVSGLESGRDYRFRVTAVDGKGKEGLASEWTTVQTVGEPSAPEWLDIPAQTIGRGEMLTLNLRPWLKGYPPPGVSADGVDLPGRVLVYRGETAGLHTVGLLASNAVGMAYCELSITVVASASYTVTIDAGITGGTVAADRAEAEEGETVELSVSADAGMKLVPGSLKVNGAAIDGLTFTMPAEAVTVTAEFAACVATVAIGGTSQTWDGTPKGVTVATEPAGLAVLVTYDGRTNRPSAAGTYAVVATVVDDFWEGSAAGTLTILPADIGGAVISGIAETYQEGEFAIEPVLTWGGRRLAEGVDYTFEVRGGTGGAATNRYADVASVSGGGSVEGFGELVDGSNEAPNMNRYAGWFVGTAAAAVGIEGFTNGISYGLYANGFSGPRAEASRAILHGAALTEISVDVGINWDSDSETSEKGIEFLDAAGNTVFALRQRRSQTIVYERAGGATGTWSDGYGTDVFTVTLRRTPGGYTASGTTRTGGTVGAIAVSTTADIAIFKAYMDGTDYFGYENLDYRQLYFDNLRYKAVTDENGNDVAAGYSSRPGEYTAVFTGMGNFGGTAERAFEVLSWPRPDLVPSWTAWPNPLEAGTAAEFSWAVANAGTATAEGAWTEELWMTNAAGSVLLATVRTNGPIAAGTGVVRSVTAAVPEEPGMWGPVGLAVKVNADEALAELPTGRTNNEAVAETRLTGVPWVDWEGIGPQTYTGEAIEPVPTVLWDGEPASGFRMEYAHNVHAGTASAAATLNGKTLVGTFEIVPADLAGATVDGVEGPYLSGLYSLSPGLTFNGKPLAEGTDYTWAVFGGRPSTVTNTYADLAGVSWGGSVEGFGDIENLSNEDREVECYAGLFTGDEAYYNAGISGFAGNVSYGLYANGNGQPRADIRRAILHGGGLREISVDVAVYSPSGFENSWRGIEFLDADGNVVFGVKQGNSAAMTYEGAGGVSGTWSSTRGSQVFTVKLTRTAGGYVAGGTTRTGGTVGDIEVATGADIASFRAYMERSVEGDARQLYFDNLRYTAEETGFERGVRSDYLDEPGEYTAVFTGKGDFTGTATAAFEVHEGPRPDLSAEWTAWPAELIPGETAAFSWRVENGGTASAAGSWTEEVWLTNAQGSVRVGWTNVEGTIEQGGAAERTAEWAVPEYPGLMGEAWAVVNVNADGGLAEATTGQGNNEASAGPVALAGILKLELASAEAKENAGRVRCVVRRSGPADAALTVSVASSRPGDAGVPETMTIPAGARSGSFYATLTDNGVVDGPRTATIAVAADGYEAATTTLRILDDEVPSLGLIAGWDRIGEGETKTMVVTRELAGEEALTVNLSGLGGGRATCPGTVTIPAGEMGAEFEVSVTDNETAQAETVLTLRASAAGHTSAKQTFTVDDDDVPGVTLELYPEMVSEGAGPNAVYATLTRTDAGKGIGEAVKVRLAASPSGQLILPSQVTIPKYTLAVRFAIGTVDNAWDDGDREVTIDGAIVIPSCGCTGQPSSGDAIQATLTVTDDDVPALSLKAEPATMKEGLSQAGWLVLGHNSSLAEDLPVELSFDVDGEIDIPATATIPAGETEVRVPVETLDDGVEDGAQLVSVYAEDPSGVFTTASTWVQVSDQNLPDLAVAEIAADAAAVALKPFAVRFAATNGGFAACTREIPYAVHVTRSRGEALGNGSVVRTGLLPAGLAVGGTAEASFELVAPEMPGDVWVSVVLDPDGTLSELDNANNTGWSAATGVSAAYLAVVEADAETYLPGDTIALSGAAELAEGGAAAGVEVDVYLMMNGMRRTLKATTGADGRFETGYTPSSGESGHYSVGACYPGVGSQAVQDEFDVLGMKRTSTGNVIWDIGLGDTETRTVTLKNLSGAALTGLTATFTGIPADCHLTWELPGTLEGNRNATLRMTATATAVTEGADYEKFGVRIDTDQGVSVDFPLYFHSQTQQAYLRSSPSSINTTMAVGHERYIDVTIANDGKGDSGAVTATVPDTRWLKIAAGARADNLAPGESMTVTLLLSPTAEDGLTLNSPIGGGGRLAVNCANGSGCSVSLRFTPVSEATGSVVVDAVDNNTYTLETAPHLAGATVRISNPYTGATVAGGTTGADGLWSAEGVPEGRWQLTVTAPNHDTYAAEIDVEPGLTARKTAFLQYQLVSATWEVVKTEIEDQYEITLVLDYETSVPAPIVRVSMPEWIGNLAEGENTTFTVHVENTGVIAAETVFLSFPDIPGHAFTLMDNNFRLAAGAARDIPVKFEHLRTKPSTRGASTVVGAWILKTAIHYLCGDQNPSYNINTRFRYGERVVETGDDDGDGDWWIIGPGATNYVTVDPIRWTNSPVNISTGGLNQATGVQITHRGCQISPCGESILGCVIDGVVSLFPPAAVAECVVGLADCGRGIFELVGDFSALGLAQTSFNCGVSVAGCFGVNEIKNISLTVIGCVGNIAIDCVIRPLVDFFTDKGAESSGRRRNAGESAFAQTYPDFAAAIATGQSYATALQNWIVEFFGDESWSDISGNELAPFLAACLEQLQTAGRLDEASLAPLKPAGVGAEALSAFLDRWNRAAAGEESDEWAGAGTTAAVRPQYLLKCALQLGECMDEAKAHGYDTIEDFLRMEALEVAADLEAQRQTVCASVKMEFSQTLAMTREAFDGTLTMYNGNGTTPIRDLKLELSVLDEEGNECRDLFEAFANGTAGDMSGEDVLAGGMTVSAGGTGSAMVRFIPERGAAPTEEKLYRFGGTVTYTDPFTGERATIKLTPVALTVSPSPYLHLDYFVQRDVYGDDPVTADTVEASLPAELAVLARNVGGGEARNVTISSVQPTIVQNEKGLAIDFRLSDYSLDRMALNGATAHLGLNTVGLGNIGAGESRVAQWWLTASIQGHFTGMQASVTPLNSWNTPDTSLVDPEVGVHKLIRSVEADGDGLPDFLTSEEGGLYGLADTIWTSVGEALDVAPAGSVGVSGTLAGAEVSLGVAVAATKAGWTYGWAAVPGAERYEIARVVREDGSEVPLRNVWITDRVFRDGVDPVWETRLHIVDECAQGEQTYTVELAAKPSDGPDVEAFEGVANGAVVGASPVAVTVVFSTDVDGATFGTDDLALRWQGALVDDLSGLRIAGEGTRWTIGGLGNVCGADGRYELVVQCAGIANLSGALGTSGRSVSWTVSGVARPAVSAFEGAVAAGTPVQAAGAVTVVFTIPVAGFGVEALRLDGAPVPGATVEAADGTGTRWVVGGLDAAAAEDGEHVLTVVGASVTGLTGLTGAADASVSWVKDTTGPEVLGVTRETGLKGEAFRVELSEAAASGTVAATLTSTVGEDSVVASEEIDWVDDGHGGMLLPGFGGMGDGTFVLTVSGSGLRDAAGNAGTGSASVSWTVDTVPPAQVQGLRIDPDLGESSSDGVTCQADVTVRGTLAADAASVTVVARYASGDEVVLAGPFAPGGTALACPVTLPGAGNMSLVVRCADTAGNASETAMEVYLDAWAPEAEWETTGTPVESALLRFSAAVVPEDVGAGRVTLTRDGVAVPLSGAVFETVEAGRTYRLSGEVFAAACDETGTYALRFDGAGVRKASSGAPMAAGAAAVAEWSYEVPPIGVPEVRATEWDSESFVAEWMAVTGADGYRATVREAGDWTSGETGAETLLETEFAGLDGDGTAVLPDGFETGWTCENTREDAGSVLVGNGGSVTVGGLSVPGSGGARLRVTTRLRGDGRHSPVFLDLMMQEGMFIQSMPGRDGMHVRVFEGVGGEVALRWRGEDASASFGLEGVRVEVVPEGANEEGEVLAGYDGVDVEGTRLEVTGLHAGTEYAVSVTAVRGRHEGAEPGEARVRTKGTQTIDFAVIGNQVSTNSVTLDAMAGSGLPVEYAVEGPAVLDGASGTLSFTGAGTVTVTASQDGNAFWEAAENVVRSFAVEKAQATVTLSGLSWTYDGEAKVPSVTTIPEGLDATVTYAGSDSAPVNAGNYAVVATVEDPIWAGQAEGTLVIGKAAQTISFAAIGGQVATNTVTLSATAGSGLPVSYAVTGPAELSGTTLTFTGAGTVTVTASQSGNANWEAAESVERQFLVEKAVATVTLSGLEWTYDGEAKAARVTTEPAGLAVAVTYAGSAAAPVNAGDYAVVATVEDPVWQGQAEGTLVIGKASQTIAFATIANQVATNTVTLSARASSGLTVSYTVTGPAVRSGTTLTFTGAGTVKVTAKQSGNANWAAAKSVSRTFQVTKAAAAVTLSGLEWTYDGEAKAASVATVPEGLAVVVTYDGNGEAPVNAGNYAVVATVEDPIWEGQAEGTLVIGKASQTIAFATIANQVATNTVTLSATAGSGLPVSYAVTGPAVRSGMTLTFTGAGTVTVTASQSGDANWEAAESVERQFLVEKAVATVTLSGLEWTYDGEAKAARVTTEPAGLAVAVTYAGSAAAPVNAGNYAVVATVEDPVWQGQAEGTLVIGKASQTITFATIANQVATNTVTLSARASSGLTVSYTVTGPAVRSGTTLTFTGAGTVKVTAKQSGNANWAAAKSVSRTFQVAKAAAVVTLSGLEWTYDGEAKAASVATVPEGLAAVVTYDGNGEAPVNAGNYAVVATVEDPIWAGSAEETMVIAKRPQGIEFTEIGTRTATEEVVLEATAESGGAVAFEVVEGPGRIEGNVLTFTGNGTVTVKASQAGDANWEASEASQDVRVLKTLQSIEFPVVGDCHATDTVELAATAASGQEVAFALAEDGPGVLEGNVLTFTGEGTVMVIAIQLGDDSWNWCVAGQIIHVSKTPQTIEFGEIGDQTPTDTVRLEAMAGSGLPVEYAVEGPAVLDGNVLSFTGTGSVTVTVRQEGNALWAAAEVSRSFRVRPEAAAGYDAWLEELGLEPATEGLSFETARETDHDGDGATNWAEYLADTDPTDPEDVFEVAARIESAETPGTRSVTLQPARPSPRRAYRLVKYPALGAGMVSESVGEAVAGGETPVFRFDADDTVFLRLKVELAEP